MSVSAFHRSSSATLQDGMHMPIQAAASSGSQNILVDARFTIEAVPLQTQSPPETTTTETVATETVATETAATETAATETVATETVATETVATETAVTDTTDEAAEAAEGGSKKTKNKSKSKKKAKPVEVAVEVQVGS